MGYTRIATKEIRENHEISVDKDIRGFFVKSRNFLEFIYNQEKPLTIGLYGKLGTGKSTFLHYFKKHLCYFKKPDCFNIDNPNIKKDDPRYHDYLYDGLLGIEKWQIVECDVFNSPDNVEEFIKVSIIFNLFKKSQLLSFIIAISIVLISTVGGVIIYWLFNLKAWSLVVLVLGLFSGIVLPYLSKDVMLKYSSMPLLKILVDVFNNGLVQLFAGKQIVIIENLDRLSPNKALIFLEKLKVTFTDKKSIFAKDLIYIIACDREALENAVIKKYKGQYVNARDYLDKLLEFSVNLPYSKSLGSIKSIPEGYIGNRFIERDVISDEMVGSIIDIFNVARIDSLRDVKSYIRELDRIYVNLQMENNSMEEQFIDKETDYLSNLDMVLVAQIIKNTTPDFFEFMVNDDNWTYEYGILYKLKELNEKEEWKYQHKTLKWVALLLSNNIINRDDATKFRTVAMYIY